MTMATSDATMVERITERLTAALETLDDTMRQGRRVIGRGRYAVEDAAAAAALGIRRRPLKAVMIAAFAGALVGGLAGFGLSRLTRCAK